MQNETAHLHDGEQLLCCLRATPAALIASFSRALLDGASVGALAGAAMFLSINMLSAQSLPAFVYFLPFVFVTALSAYLRYSVWKRALFRVTTERILLEFPGRLMRTPMRTIKWSQYQESYLSRPTPFDIPFFSRPIVIRFGNADGNNETSFPSLRYADDIKHYLDKIDSAIRRKDEAAIKPFVFMPRGKRD